MSIATAAKKQLELKREEARIFDDSRPGEGISKSWRTNWVDTRAAALPGVISVTVIQNGSQ